MRGLLLLLPMVSCAFAVGAYVFGGGLWTILAAFFVAGPLVIVLLGLLLSGRADDSRDNLPGDNRN